MSAASGTLVCADMLSANKGTAANENVFTERNEALDAPRNFNESRTNVQIINDMVLNGNARDELLDAYPELKLLTFEDKFYNENNTTHRKYIWQY